MRFAMLHKLGDKRIAEKNDSVLATVTKNGGVAVALWNYLPPVVDGAKYQPELADAVGTEKTFEVELKNVSGGVATLWRVDGQHGNAIPAYDAMGRPPTPTREQIAELRKAGMMTAPENLEIKDGKVTVKVPPRGLAVLTVGSD